MLRHHNLKIFIMIFLLFFFQFTSIHPVSIILATDWSSSYVSRCYYSAAGERWLSAASEDQRGVWWHIHLGSWSQIRDQSTSLQTGSDQTQVQLQPPHHLLAEQHGEYRSTADSEYRITSSFLWSKLDIWDAFAFNSNMIFNSLASC